MVVAEKALDAPRASAQSAGSSQNVERTPEDWPPRGVLANQVPELKDPLVPPHGIPLYPPHDPNLGLELPKTNEPEGYNGVRAGGTLWDVHPPVYKQQAAIRYNGEGKPLSTNKLIVDEPVQLVVNGQEIDTPLGVVGKKLKLMMGDTVTSLAITAADVSYDGNVTVAVRGVLPTMAASVTAPIVAMDDTSSIPISLNGLSIRWNGSANCTSITGDGLISAYGLTDSTSSSEIFLSVTGSDWTKMVHPLTKAQRFRQRIRDQLRGAGVPRQKRYLDHVKEGDPEFKARGLLRELIGEHHFRNYMRRGFIMVQGRSGLLYKIMRGCASQSIRSYGRTKNGKWAPFENICIIFKKNGLPPTDSVIMRMMMCQRDEWGLRSMANVSHVHQSRGLEFDLGQEYANLGAKALASGSFPYRLANEPELVIRDQETTGSVRIA